MALEKVKNHETALVLGASAEVVSRKKAQILQKKANDRNGRSSKEIQDDRDKRNTVRRLWKRAKN